jgi:O-antigen ligase
MTPRIASSSILSGFDRARWCLAADAFAAGVAVFVPWSTTLTEIFVVLWLVAFLPTLFLPVADFSGLRNVLRMPAGFLPVVLCALAAIGMLWAFDVSWTERLGGFAKFPRLMLIALLLAHFVRSERGLWVVYGFLAATTLLLLASLALAAFPGLPWHGKGFGVPVNDYIRQSTCFMVCVFGLLGAAIERARAGTWWLAIGLIALAALFLGDILFVVSSRTSLFVAPILLLLLGWREFCWKGVLAAVVLGIVVSGAGWLSSPYLRERLSISMQDWKDYRASDTANSTGLRAEFLKKSVSFIATAPIIGHGTGSIPQQFRNAAIGESGAAAAASKNPHNQIFAVAIQLGAVGALVLLAMWAAHVLLFTGGGLIAWIGMTVVADNFLSSLFNSHLFDTGQGWLYIFGVGVAGGMVLRGRKSVPRSP